MKNAILLRRKNKVIVSTGQSVLPSVYLASALKNVESLGFTFSPSLLNAVRTFSAEEFVSFYKEISHILKEKVGAHVQHVPMYPNFPEQVMEASAADLYINAVIHYTDSFIRDITKIETSGSLPKFELKERFPLFDRLDLNVIELGSEKEFYELILQLLSANSSISASDKEDIESVIQAHETEFLYQTILPDSIPMKENIAFLVAVLHKHEKSSIDQLAPYFKTATDVLRLAAALSDGDVSLASNTTFRKFKRSERRLLLGLLESCGNITEDMLRYKGPWVRLGEILHPGEYKHKFPKVKEAFDVLRNNVKVETFNGTVEKALENKNVKEALSLLVTRPGELARRLDHLCRASDQAATVIQTFSSVAEQVATPVLLQVMAHFKHRDNEQELRAFFPKGNVAKVKLIENELPFLHPDICLSVVEVCENTLKARFSSLPFLGKVLLDDRLKEQLVPFSQRSASKALRTIVRGSKLDMPEGDTLRFFLYWKEGKVNEGFSGRVDIDLSAVMYDENWNYMEHISYTNLSSSTYRAAHSGDITAAPMGASEFIDLDIPSIVQYGGRYVVTSLYCFTEQAFVDVPECFAGWMVRREPGSGEIFEPATVQDKIDLSADTQIAIPVILDLAERKVIWTDLALRKDPQWVNNLESNQTGLVAVGKAISSLAKPNLYDLFTLHALARGEIVQAPEKADTIFSLNEGITPFDIELIMAEYMA